MWVLGINCPPGGWHDPAACLLDDAGNVVAFAEEERFSRRKHGTDQAPRRSAAFCLRQADLRPEDVDVVAVGWDIPRVVLRDGGRWDFTSPQEFLASTLGWELAPASTPEVVFVPHHLAHAVASFYASGFAEAAILVVDGDGEDESISIYTAQHGRHPVRKRMWPRTHSLGWFYDAASQLLGYNLLECGKTMGLSAYGRAASLMPWDLVSIGTEDFSFPFHLRPTARYDLVVAHWRKVLREHAGGPVRASSWNYLHRDDRAVRIAWSAQLTLQRVMGFLADLSRRISGIEALCLGGGVMLNCSANGTIPEPVYAPPVPHDAGVALGAAWYVSPPRHQGTPLSPFLGRAASYLEAREAVSHAGLRMQDVTVENVVERLLRGEIGAIVEGRAEIGPRALGHRSIVAIPSPASVRNRVNQLKRREPWRPFAPVGLPSVDGQLWTRRDYLADYMLGAVDVTPRGHEALPAAVHVDGTTRPQVLRTEEVWLIRGVLEAMSRGGMTPVLLNTSFNGRGEPIVNTASQALDSFESCNLDFLVLGENLLTRE